MIVAFTLPAHAMEGWLPLPTETVQRIAFGSCAQQWQEQPIWNSVVAEQPDLFLFLGDAIYGDYDGKDVFTPTQQTLERDWNMLANKPGFRVLRKQVSVMATWDNHDYGTHNGGAEFALKEMTQKVFLDFFGEPHDSVRRRTPGIYDARIFGPAGKRVQVILLDTRYFKGPFVKDSRTKEQKQAAGLSGSLGNYLPNNDPSVSLLGDVQWQWLEREFKKPAEVRLLVSSTQVIPDQKAMDEWGNYPLERRRLFELIRESKAGGVLILSGNVHFAEISQLDDFPYPLIEFTSSGMTHNNPVYAEANNSYRVVGPYAEENFGMLDIDWSAQPAPMITLRIVDIDGRSAVEHQIGLGELQIH